MTKPVPNHVRKPGPGRKSKAEEAGMKALLDAAFTDADRATVVRNLVAMAKGAEDPKTCLAATQLLLAYTYGKPTERKEVTGAEGQALEIVVKYATEDEGEEDSD